MAEAETNKTQPQTPPPPPTAETEQYLFYNVMPKPKSSPMVSPTVTVVDAPEPAAPASKAKISLSPRLKRYILYAIIILILAVIGYFIWYKFGTQSYKNQTFVVNNPAHTPHPTPTLASQSTTSPLSNILTTPSDWQLKFFGNGTCSDFNTCGDNADPDRDGLTNVQEYKQGTDPNNPDSDGDGLSDGDEANVFLTNPLNSHTTGDPKYSDSDFLTGGYSLQTNQPFTQAEITQLRQRMLQYGLHEPTVKTLGDTLLNTYGFSPSSGTSTPPAATSTPNSTGSNLPAGLDQSPQAKQDRDAQRSSTMQNLGIALIKYQQTNKQFPSVNAFLDMATAVKPYNPVATNPVDPINVDPYIYGYVSLNDGIDFTLSFYSETQNQLIKLHAADAQKYLTNQQAIKDDDQRQTDLSSLQSALLVYSSANVAGSQDYVFPPKTKLQSALVPQYLSAIPKDPKTNAPYDYQVSSTFSSFIIKAVLETPPAGNTGYECDENSCQYY